MFGLGSEANVFRTNGLVMKRAVLPAATLRKGAMLLACGIGDLGNPRFRTMFNDAVSSERTR